MKALERALRINCPHEREYLKELVGLRREIEFLENFIDESPSHRSLTPMVEGLEERVSLIRQILRRPELPPMSNELRNPFTRQRTPDETEYIKQLIRKHSGKRIKPVPVE